MNWNEFWRGQLGALLVIASLGLVGACQTAGSLDDGSAPDAANEDNPAAGDVESEEEPEEEEVKKLYIVGTVKYLRDGFVLVERSRKVWPKKDVELKAFTAESEETAILGWSPERAGRYFAADILEGEPNEGDLVIAFPPEGSDETGLTPVSGVEDPMNSEVFWPARGDAFPGAVQGGVSNGNGSLPTASDLPPLSLPPGVERPELPDAFKEAIEEGAE